METYTDHLAGHSQTQRMIADIGRILNGQPLAHASDSHGNEMINSTITCANGQTVDVSYWEGARDQAALVVNATLLEVHEDGVGRTYTLGDLQSPLQTRCEDAAERLQR